jgi:hypothetical protein
MLALRHFTCVLSITRSIIPLDLNLRGRMDRRVGHERKIYCNSKLLEYIFIIIITATIDLRVYKQRPKES